MKDDTTNNLKIKHKKLTVSAKQGSELTNAT